MQKAQDKLSLYIIRISLTCLMVLVMVPSLAAGQESYRFERMWPTLPQPWYFNKPQGMDIAPDGTLYVCDSSYFRIKKFTQDGYFITAWGNEGTGDGEFGAGNSGLPFGPKGVAVGSDGSVYVADTGNHRIQRFTPDGTFHSKWGRNGGDGSYGTGNGEFQYPSGIGVDSDGYVYVSDYYNHRIQKFTPDGTYVDKWGRNEGDGSYGTGDGEFQYPMAIAVDSDGYVFVADHSNYRIQKFSSDGTFIVKWDNSLPGGARFGSIRDITTGGNGTIYATDWGRWFYEGDDYIFYPSSIHKIGPSGELIESWEHFAMPSGITANENFVYVTNVTPSAYGITKLTLDGTVLHVWTAYEMGEYQLMMPDGIVIGGDGRVYVTDKTDHRIHLYAKDGIRISPPWGEFGSDDRQFRQPLGIAVDESGSVYVCDRGNNRIQKFTREGQFVTAWGSADGLALQPEGIALDSNGNVYVTDHASQVIDDPDQYGMPTISSLYRIQKFKPNAGGTEYAPDGMWETWGGNDEAFVDPSGITVKYEDGTEYVYVVDTVNVHKFNLDGSYATTWMGTEEGNTLNHNFHGIATDESGNVYLADSNNSRVLKFTAEGELITSFGVFGSGPGQMNEFHYIAVDSDEKVYVADTFNNRIQVFAKTEGIGNNKAVIVAGGGPYTGNNLWDATQMTASFAYRALGHQGFGAGDIYYLSADTDLDLDDDGDPNVFGIPDNQNLNNAIQLAGGNNTDNLIVYLTDHGGINQDGSGSFLLSHSETLTSTALAEMIDSVQPGVPGRITVIMDACQSGSFMDDLQGNNRIIITSSSEEQQAKFLNQGTISFSHFFWSYIFSGASLDDAFSRAGEAVNFVISDQTPLKTGDTRDVYIGNATKGMLGEVPGIAGEVGSFPDELTIETSAVLSVDGVRDPDGDLITRVWAVIWPPDYETGSEEDPLLSLPTVDLQPVGENSYAAPYSEFHAIGAYQVAVYAMDDQGNTSLPQFTIVPKSISRRAVIVAGGEGPGIGRGMIEHNARLAYNTLRSQHYSIDDIYLMSVTAFSVKEEDDGEIITRSPTTGNFKGDFLDRHLIGDGSIATLDLTIYLIGGSEEGAFILNDEPDHYETLSASKLDEWLDEVQGAKPGRVTVICDFDRSGTFIREHTLSEGNQRITIASTGDESAAYFNSAGNISFSSFWWDQVAAGARIGDAFIYARKAIAYCSRANDVSFSCYRPQSPLIDANENGVGNEAADYTMVEKLKIGDGIVTADDPPKIGSVSAVREGQIITITAGDINFTSPIKRVWAIISPLRYCPGTSGEDLQAVDEIDLQGPDGEGKYTNTYSADYACRITVYAMSDDTEGNPNISQPVEARIYQEGGTEDIYEPDNKAGEANWIIVNYPTPQPHTFHGMDDEDWVKFYGVEKDDDYIIEASNLGDNCPLIELYDGDDNLIDDTRNEIPTREGKVWINFSCQKSGTYYVSVVWGGGCDFVAGKMNYDLKVFDGNQGLTAIVAGKVENRFTGEPIDGAVINSIGGVGRAISTRGEYILSEIQGTWTLTADKAGYQTSSVSITVESADQYIRKDIDMGPRSRSSCGDDADCDDELFCNGVETCVDGTCQPGTGPCTDDSLYCNGVESCDEESDICEHSGSPCPGHLACVEENDQCVEKECASNTDCDNGAFCDGVEVCTNDLCQAGTPPCTEPRPACDEENDLCTEGPAIQLLPNPCLKSRWMPLLMFVRVMGKNTHFDTSSSVTFDPPGTIMALLPAILRDSTHLFMIGLLLPSWLAPEQSVEVTVKTGAEVVSEELKLFMLGEGKE